MNQDNKPSASAIVTGESCDQPALRPLSNQGAMRRDWLKNVMIGSMGLGLFGIPLPARADMPVIKGCPRIVRISKDVKAEIGRYVCKSCLCGNDRVFMISLEFKGQVNSNKVCDESIRQVPNRSIVKGSLRYTVRGGICPETKTSMLWGCHEGKLMLYSPSGRPLFEGELSGTEGLNAQASSAKRCCWPYGAGSLAAAGAEEMKACKLCTTYLLKVPFNFRDPCVKTPPKELYMQLDGTIMCPC